MSGLDRSFQKGFGVDFAQYRSYQFGDDLHRVDWKLYGRTDRLYLKQSDEETQLRVFLVLDTSASMFYSSKPGTWLRKIDFARTLLAALGLVSQRQNDAFGLALIGTDLDLFLKPKASHAHWRITLGCLEAMQSGRATGLAKGLGSLAPLLPRRSLVVIASDFYEDNPALKNVLRRFHHDHQEVIALQTLDPAEIELNEDWNGTFVDAESGQRLKLDAVAARQCYLERFQSFLHQTQTTFLDQSGDYSLMRTDSASMAALGSYLARRRRLG